jgi:hypothetical protein
MRVSISTAAARPVSPRRDSLSRIAPHRLPRLGTATPRSRATEAVSTQRRPASGAKAAGRRLPGQRPPVPRVAGDLAAVAAEVVDLTAAEEDTDGFAKVFRSERS